MDVLVREARVRLDQWLADGGLYDGVGGKDLVGDIPGFEEFVGKRLPEELAALRDPLFTFHDLRGDGG